MEKRIQILVGFSARRNIGDFCHPRVKVPYCTSIAPETASPDMKSQGARRTLLSILTDSRVAEESVHAQAWEPLILAGLKSLSLTRRKRVPRRRKATYVICLTYDWPP